MDGNNSEAIEIDSNTENVLTIEELYELVNAHIEFFSDAEMTQRITQDNMYTLVWDEEQAYVGEFLEEKQAVIYWKWHYEYPFDAEEAMLPNAQKAEKIDNYDEEDMMIGNNISAMKFYFTFSAQ